MSPSDASILIDAIHKSGYELNHWESDFIDSINDQIDMNAKLSEKQSSKLQEIYRRAHERI